MQLQVAFDASREAMYIVSFFREEFADGSEVFSVSGKCRMAPIKQPWRPRLDRQVALYSVRLRKLNVEEHDLLIDSVTHWTDCFAFLRWLQSVDYKKNDSFASRAAKKLEGSIIVLQRHNKGGLNPSENC